jgi:hypothetical protein
MNCIKCGKTLEEDLVKKLQIMAELFGEDFTSHFVCDTCYVPTPCPPDCESCKWERENLSESS